MLTAIRWNPTADTYLLEDLVGCGEMDFPCWIFTGKVGISYGPMDFWLCKTVLFCYANSFIIFSVFFIFVYFMCLLYFVSEEYNFVYLRLWPQVNIF